MKKLLLTLSIIATISLNSFGQWCGASVSGGTITPATTAQTTTTFNGNRTYFTFTGQAGCEYTFSTCGLSTNDTYLRLYDATGATLIAENDDFCGAQSTLQVLFNVTGTYTIHVSRFSCNTLTAPTQLSYSVNCTFNDNECYGATQICNDAPFSANTASPGTYQELNASNQGCLAGGEHQSYWYYFQPVLNGTITFNINTCATCDYDFALWATGNCGNLGAPIRCSFDATEGVTGLNASAADNSEGAGGFPFPNPSPKFVAPLNVVAGQTYVLLIDNFTANNEAFAIDFNFSTPGLLNCTPVVLPVSLIDFSGKKFDAYNEISWTTEFEVNADKFILEWSNDPVTNDWTPIYTTEAKGGNSDKTYGFQHTPNRGALNYYRLVQVDKNGESTYAEKLVVLDNTMNRENYVKVLNTMGQEVDCNTKGVLIYVFADGTIERVFNH